MRQEKTTHDCGGLPEIVCLAPMTQLDCAYLPSPSSENPRRNVTFLMLVNEGMAADAFEGAHQTSHGQGRGVF